MKKTILVFFTIFVSLNVFAGRYQDGPPSVEMIGNLKGTVQLGSGELLIEDYQGGKIYIISKDQVTDDGFASFKKCVSYMETFESHETHITGKNRYADFRFFALRPTIKNEKLVKLECAQAVVNVKIQSSHQVPYHDQ